jgi:hypothetical protein
MSFLPVDADIPYFIKNCDNGELRERGLAIYRNKKSTQKEKDDICTLIITEESAREKAAEKKIKDAKEYYVRRWFEENWHLSPHPLLPARSDSSPS